MKRIAIIQSNYIPWIGYLKMIEAVDHFILLDDVQYTRRDWRNRNKIMTPKGEQWLTIPLNQDNYFAKIYEMEVSDPLWTISHFDILRKNYRTSPNWKRYEDELEWAYIDAPTNLSQINRRFLNLGCAWLDIKTPITDSMTYAVTGVKSERLIALCRSVGATHYLSGPSAKSYLDEAAFLEAGIQVEWMQYKAWPKLTFLHGLFHGLEAD